MDNIHALAARHGGQCLSTEYAGPTGKLRWRCSKGHEWITSPARVRNGFWCAICAKQRRRSSRLEEMHLLAANRGRKCLSDTYETRARLLRWQCRRGHPWLAAPSNIKGGAWCPKCARAERVRITAARWSMVSAVRAQRRGQYQRRPPGIHAINRLTIAPVEADASLRPLVRNPEVDSVPDLLVARAIRNILFVMILDPVQAT
jgi:hypothetical protein